MQIDSLFELTGQTLALSPASVTPSKITRLDRDQQGSGTSSGNNPESTVSVSDAAIKKQLASTDSNHQITFETNESSNHVVVKVIDKDSGEVVREIPGEQLQKLSQRIHDYQKVYFNLG